MDYNLSFLDLVEIEYEFIILENQLDLIEEQMQTLIKKSEHVLEAKRKVTNYYPENPEWHEDQREHYEFVDYILPRIFHNSYLVSLWAGFESTLTELSKLINKREDIRLRLDELRGGFIDRADKFYDIFLNIQLFEDDLQKKRIKDVYEVRNLIAHANGRIESSKKRRIEKFEKHEGVDVYQGSIVLSKIFNKKAYSEIKSVVNSLLLKYKEVYKISGA